MVMWKHSAIKPISFRVEQLIDSLKALTVEVEVIESVDG